MKLLTFALALALHSVSAFAGVAAYTGDSGEKLFIEGAPSLGKDVFLVKLEGPEAAWAGKVIQTKRTTGHASGDRYSFDYDLELSSGVQKRNYQMIVGKGFELVNGSRVQKIQVFFPGGDARKPLELNHDKELTNSSQKINLIAEHKKSPFKPEVD